MRLCSCSTHIGDLTYVRQGKRENTAFAYTPAWLANPDAFSVSPDLALISGHQIRKAPSASGSCFHFAMADTAPDAWGRRVILRELTELDFLLAVDDFSRIGALRLQDLAGAYLRTVEQGQRTTPAMLELQHMFEASRAVETGTKSADDLRYLVGKGTSLGGMRPKCTVIDDSGLLTPAFDHNPFPDKDCESKTWLSADVGPVMALAPLMAHCAYFSLTPALALAALTDVVKSVSDWRTVARHATVGLHSHELDDFAPAFEHGQMDAARKLLGG